MTALAGLWRFDGRPDAGSDCARMLASQALYGPEAGATWSEGDVSLGSRLMRLLPEDSFDRQPLIGGGGRYVLVADLRLDNREELTGQLKISSEKASRLCDAAILLTAIERWGEACVERLVGDYAFALWNRERRNLLLVRDPLGQRPLHYHSGNGFFAFASMPKGLHALAAVPYEPDEEGLAQYLLLMPTTGTRTYFRGIERLLPGHTVTVTPEGLAARRHWKPSIRPLRLRHTEEYCEGLRSHLDQAVKCRLRGAKELSRPRDYCRSLVGGSLLSRRFLVKVMTVLFRAIALPMKEITRPRQLHSIRIWSMCWSGPKGNPHSINLIGTSRCSTNRSSTIAISYGATRSLI
jgi:asparagine synthase (glutamine-hydrolysing)